MNSGIAGINSNIPNENFPIYSSPLFITTFYLLPLQQGCQPLEGWQP